MPLSTSISTRKTTIHTLDKEKQIKLGATSGQFGFLSEFNMPQVTGLKDHDLTVAIYNSWLLNI